MKMNLQMFGGRGGGSGLSGGGGSGSFFANNAGKYMDEADSMVRNDERFVGEKDLKKQARDILNHRLGYGEEYASPENITISQVPTEGGMADVDIGYSVDVSIPVFDRETGSTSYIPETEYRETTLKLKVFK